MCPYLRYYNVWSLSGKKSIRSVKFAEFWFKLRNSYRRIFPSMKILDLWLVLQFYIGTQWLRLLPSSVVSRGCLMKAAASAVGFFGENLTFLFLAYCFLSVIFKTIWQKSSIPKVLPSICSVNL